MDVTVGKLYHSSPHGLVLYGLSVVNLPGQKTLRPLTQNNKSLVPRRLALSLCPVDQEASGGDRTLSGAVVAFLPPRAPQQVSPLAFLVVKWTSLDVYICSWISPHFRTFLVGKVDCVSLLPVQRRVQRLSVLLSLEGNLITIPNGKRNLLVTFGTRKKEPIGRKKSLTKLSNGSTLINKIIVSEVA